MNKSTRMRKDHKQLLHDMFVMAVELTEAAHDAAMIGQNSHTKPRQLHRQVHKLRKTAADLQIVAQSLEIAIKIRSK